MMAPALGRVGLWSAEMRFGDPGKAPAIAAEIEAMGYGALWLPGGIDDAVLADVSRMLDMTETLVIATGILNIWKIDARDVAAWFAGLPDAHASRVLLGLGVSHAPIIGEQWGRPLAVMGAYLDRLQAAKMDMSQTCLAALGPKMVRLSGARTSGAHPYLVSPDHTRNARAVLGEGPLLAPEQGVILESDPAKAMALARGTLEHYARLPNYRDNWVRMGFTEAQIDACDPQFVEAIFAMGSVEAAVERIRAHHEAGADHVCVQVIDGPMNDAPDLRLDHWRALAGALAGDLAGHLA